MNSIHTEYERWKRGESTDQAPNEVALLKVYDIILSEVSTESIVAVTDQLDILFGAISGNNLLVLRVAAMRDAQRDYFRAIAMAKKSRAGKDWKKADDALRHAKDLEAIVDHQVFNILNQTSINNESHTRTRQA